VTTLSGRGILPVQAIADHVNDPADDTPVVNPRLSVRSWKVRAGARHLLFGEQEQLGHGGYLRQSQNNADPRQGRKLMGPDPRVVTSIGFLSDRRLAYLNNDLRLISSCNKSWHRSEHRTKCNEDRTIKVARNFFNAIAMSKRQVCRSTFDSAEHPTSRGCVSKPNRKKDL